MMQEQRPQSWAQRVGSRVVVRHRLPDGGLTDTVGQLEALEQSDDGVPRLRLRTARGEVVVPLDAVLLGKVVPPRPSRRGPPHVALSIGDLQRVMAWHWVAAETEPLGQWLLRADGGVTGRANSAMVVGDPGLPLPAALDSVQAWYWARGLPALASVAVPDPAVRAGPDADRVASHGGRHADADAQRALRAALDGLGWRPGGGISAYALTASTAQLASAFQPGSGLGSGLRSGLGRGVGWGELTLDLAGEPDDGWIATSRYRERTLPTVALRLLRSAGEQVFASVRDGERTVAVARGSLAQAWGGVMAVEVVPEHRRRGLARLLLGELARWARDRGAASMFLQTTVHNAPAQALYLSSGFTMHHRYDYLTPAGPNGGLGHEPIT